MKKERKAHQALRDFLEIKVLKENKVTQGNLGPREIPDPLEERFVPLHSKLIYILQVAKE